MFHVRPAATRGSDHLLSTVMVLARPVQAIIEVGTRFQERRRVYRMDFVCSRCVYPLVIVEGLIDLIFTMVHRAHRV